MKRPTGRPRSLSLPPARNAPGQAVDDRAAPSAAGVVVAASRRAVPWPEASVPAGSGGRTAADGLLYPPLASPASDRVPAGGDRWPASVLSGHPISRLHKIGWPPFSSSGTLAGFP
ncbi:MAG: hypothetical protein ACRD0G_17745, partial [Acidimicrobiales bacterium]